METMNLNNGLTIPSLGFGSFLIPPGDDTVNAVLCALQSGYTHIDTAAIYRNEQSVGEAVRRSGIPRQDLFITSKLWNSERGYDTTLRAFDRTMEALGMDYLDLYLIHWPANRLMFGDDAERLNLDTWHAMERLNKEGRIRTIGVSNFMPHQLKLFFDEAETIPAVDQIEFHPGFTQQACVDFCHEKGIVVEAWSPLGRGAALTDGLIQSIASKHGRTPAQVVIRWVLQKGVLPLVKSVNPARIAENLQVLDFALDQADMDAIATLSTDRIGSDPDGVIV